MDISVTQLFFLFFFYKSPHPEGIFVKKEQEKKARRGTKPKPPKKAEKKTKKNKDKKGRLILKNQ